MRVYSVTMPGGTKDSEFEAYTRLLEDVGIDVSNSPRVAERGSDRRWLYAWDERIRAERFAAELRRRTGNPGWSVHEFDAPGEEHGPVAPLEIASVPEQNGYTYYLTPASRERVISAFPGTRLPNGLNVDIGNQNELLVQEKIRWWFALAQILTCRTEDEIDALGGIRIFSGGDTIVFQRVPTAA